MLGEAELDPQLVGRIRTSVFGGKCKNPPVKSNKPNIEKRLTIDLESQR